MFNSLRTTRAKVWGIGLLTLAIWSIDARESAGQSSMDLRVLVFAGVLNPRGELPDAPILTSAGNVVSYGDLDVLPTFGLGLEARLPALPVAARISVTRSFTGEETGRWGCAGPQGEPLPCPAILIEVATDITTTTAAMDAVVDLTVGSVSVQPVIGIGWMRYAYRWSPEAVGGFSLAPGASTDDSAALRLGLEVGLPVGRYELRAHYLDSYSASDRRRPSRAGTVGVAFVVPVS